MPVFATPASVTATIELAWGGVRLTASDRADTVVEVVPTDPSDDEDVRAAERTRVEYGAGRLEVITPKHPGFGLFGRNGSVEVTIDLPAGSGVVGDVGHGTVRGSGRLGDCRIKTGAGDVRLDGVAALAVHTGAGEIVVERVTGDANVRSGAGAILLGSVDGATQAKTSAGSMRIGAAGGDVRVTTANGDILVERPRADVTAATANGDVRVGAATRGATSLRTGSGTVEIGIPAGTAARLDVRTSFGQVVNELGDADAPAVADEQVEIHARTGYGDILVRRAADVATAV